MNKSKIKELFYEILNKYELSELQVIQEFSTCDKAEEWLDEEIEEYKRRITELLGI